MQRLAQRHQADPVAFERLFDLVRAEQAAGQHTESTSCTKGLLWLKRRVASPTLRTRAALLRVLQRGRLR